MEPDRRPEPGCPTSGQLLPAGFSGLDGFGQDDLAAAFTCFSASAAAILAAEHELRPARPIGAALLPVCRSALACGPTLTQAEARSFFEDHFEPVALESPNGAPAFFTGYYEPEVEGSPERAAGFEAPLLARPDDLRTFAADEPRPPWADHLAAARIGPDGALSPYPDRAAIEAAAMAGQHRPVVWLRDWVEVFLIQVQGSAGVRLPDGRLLRVTYAGRNGHPYTSVGKLLVDGGHIAPDAMSLDRLKDWLRRNGQEPGMPGRAIMQRNASYVFFDAKPGSADGGPIGGQGLPLTRLRSIAVDRGLWCYGLPFWIDATLPWEGASTSRFRRLMVAQDTGSAILGPARADLFFGSGDEAGRIAGGIRHSGSMTVLRPKPGAGSPP